MLLAATQFRFLITILPKGGALQRQLGTSVGLLPRFPQSHSQGAQQHLEPQLIKAKAI